MRCQHSIVKQLLVNKGKKIKNETLHNSLRKWLTTWCCLLIFLFLLDCPNGQNIISNFFWEVNNFVDYLVTHLDTIDSRSLYYCCIYLFDFWLMGNWAKWAYPSWIVKSLLVTVPFKLQVTSFNFDSLILQYILMVRFPAWSSQSLRFATTLVWLIPRYQKKDQLHIGWF